MLSDDDLARMLTGTDGVPGLDAAREVRELRTTCEELRGQCQTMQETMLKYQDVSEFLMHEKAAIETRFGSLLEAMANMIASAHA